MHITKQGQSSKKVAQFAPFLFSNVAEVNEGLPFKPLKSFERTKEGKLLLLSDRQNLVANEKRKITETLKENLLIF